MNRSINFALLLAVAITVVLSGAIAVQAEAPAAAANAGAAAEMPEFKKMKLKELRTILDDRGMECKGCAEKADYVERAAEVFHLPLKVKAEAPPAAATADEGKAASPDELDEIMRKMNDGPDPSGDPERDKIMKKLHKKGLKFAGANTMPLDQLKNLEQAMGGMGGGGGGMFGGDDGFDKVGKGAKSNKGGKGGTGGKGAGKIGGDGEEL